MRAKPHPKIVIPLVDLRAQHLELRQELAGAMSRVVGSADFILGSEVSTFETSFAEFVGVDHAVGVSSGLDALRLALIALNIGLGDKVIVPANTYIATALAVSSIGATPVFVDCDPITYNISTDAVEQEVDQRTRAIIAVHLTGQPADMKGILDIAGRFGMPVIEDASQAHGAKYGGRIVGGLGKLGCFSLYPSKNLGACGDAGVITTQDNGLAKRLQQLRNYGQSAKNIHTETGLNARLDTLQAAVLNVKLGHLGRWLNERHRIASAYRELLNGIGDLHINAPSPEVDHVYHLFMIETSHRDGLRRYLAQAGIETGVHYPKPIYGQDAYKKFANDKHRCPNAERISRRLLSLPMYPELSHELVEQVVTQITGFYGSNVRRKTG